MRRQLHALRLASRESRGRLTQAQISEPDFFQHSQLLDDLGHAGKKLQRFLDGRVQNFMDIFPAIAHVQNLRLIAGAFALLTDQFHVRQKLHFNRDRTVALAHFAAAARHVE